jgi:hypothetical protein
VFDFRYHALSLAAVLMALAVGVLLGVAIGDSNLVSSAKSGIVAQLRRDVGGANQQAAQLRSQLTARGTFESDLYPIAVGGRLAGHSIGLIFLGSPSDQIDGLVRDALPPAGAQLSLVGTIREPLDVNGLAADALGTRYSGLALDPTLLKAFGTRIGAQLASGGQLIGRVRDHLLSSFNGKLGRLDGVVIVHNEPAGMTAPDAQAVTQFESGLAAGLQASRLPVVGVELSNASPSQIPWFKAQNMSSVDDLDDLSGQTALVFALAGARGTYGSKPTAESLLPRAVLPAATP